MNKMKSLVFLVLLAQSVVSQNELFFTNYTWEENPSYSVEGQTNESIIAIKDKIVTEFYFQGKEGLVEYFLEHRVLWLNSDEKIEDYNKVYLPYSSTSELQVNRARVITADGKILELDESKILTAEDDESGKKYKFFAFEGIEKGSFIEYYYVVKRSPKYKGRRLTFQTSYPKNNVEFDLFAPNNLIFKFKSYNDIPEVERDSLIENKRHWKFRVKDLKGLEKEDVSAYHASKGFIVYKLDQNTASNNKDISSYSKVSQNIYAYYYPEHSKKTQGLIRKFISKVALKTEKNEEAIIRKLEYFIKTNVFISKASGASLSDLNEVLDKKVANETGVMKLYAALLKALNIKHEIVLTSDRQDLKFDRDFEANNFLTDFLIYFPKSRLYMSPIENDSRFGFPPAYLTDNYGLFIKEVTVGDFKSAIGKIKYIKPVKAKLSTDKMIIDVDFEKDNLLKNNIRLDRSLEGYYAMYIQPYIHLAKDDDREKLIESFAKRMNEDITIVAKNMINGDPELFGIKPLQMVVDFNSEAFVERAGKKYLLKVGELIGAQMELYQEKKRVLPVESEFNRSYYRTINIKIPQGYEIANLDDINIDNSYDLDGKELMSFKSFYEIKNDVLVITADEHYRINIIETSMYENYRTVINSAADFNKITLVFEPISE